MNKGSQTEDGFCDVERQQLCENLCELYHAGQYCDVTLQSAMDNTK